MTIQWTSHTPLTETRHIGFDITDSELVANLTGAASNGESVGKFIALARKRGALTQQTA